MRRFFIIFLTVAGFFACKTDKTQSNENQQLYDEVMSIHDEVMPKMRDIRQLSKKLKNHKDYENDEKIMGTLSKLEVADEAMMDWMAQFKMPKNVSLDEELQFLQGQLISVNSMKDQMLSAIDEAEQLLKILTKESHE